MQLLKLPNAYCLLSAQLRFGRRKNECDRTTVRAVLRARASGSGDAIAKGRRGLSAEQERGGDGEHGQHDAHLGRDEDLK